MTVARWAIGLVLLGGSIASANTRLFVSVGWDGAYKNGRWVPIFVDIADTTPRMVNLEIDAAHDQNSSMVIRQRVAAGPQSTTYVLFAPLTQSAEGTSVRLVDDAGHLLAETDIADYQSNAKFGLGPGDLLIGTSGRSSSRQLLLGQLSEMTNGTGELDICASRQRPSGMTRWICWSWTHRIGRGFPSISRPRSSIGCGPAAIWSSGPVAAWCRARAATGRGTPLPNRRCTGLFARARFAYCGRPRQTLCKNLRPGIAASR